jgi:hypothetical protein
MVSSLVSYALWVVHGFQVHDEALVIGQGFGVITTAVIVVQMYLYRKPAASQKSARISRPPLLWFTAMQTRSAMRQELRKHDTPGANIAD